MISVKNKRNRDRVGFKYNIMCFKKINKKRIEDTAVAIRIQVNDISYGGVGITCNMPIETGEILVFNIVLKDSRKMEVYAEVKWHSYNAGKYKAGLEFKNLNRDDVVLIHDIIKNSNRKNIRYVEGG